MLERLRRGLLERARVCGFARLELRPGVAVAPGEAAWEVFCARGTAEDVAAARRLLPGETSPEPVDQYAETAGHDDGADDGGAVGNTSAIAHQLEGCDDARALIALSAARRAIAEARDIDDLKHVRDRSEALCRYAKARGDSLALQNEAAEVKLRAERRAGELLREIERSTGGRPSKNAGRAGPGFRAALRQADITASTAKRWQREAMVPAAGFERFLSQTKAAGQDITAAALLRLARHVQRSPRDGDDAGTRHDHPIAELLAQLERNVKKLWAQCPSSNRSEFLALLQHLEMELGAARIGGDGRRMRAAATNEDGNGNVLEVVAHGDTAPPARNR